MLVRCGRKGEACCSGHSVVCRADGRAVVRPAPAALDCMWLRLPLPLPTHIRIPASSCMRVPGYVGRTAPLPTPAALLRSTINQPTLDQAEQASSPGASCRRTNISLVSKLTARGLTSRRRCITLKDPGRCSLVPTKGVTQRSQVVCGTPQTTLLALISCRVRFGTLSSKHTINRHHGLPGPSPGWSLERELARMSGRRTSATKSVRGLCGTLSPLLYHLC